MAAIAVQAVNARALTGLEFQGNHAYSARRLRREMSMGRTRRIPQDSLPAALDRLASFYRRNGYVQSRVEFVKDSTGGVKVLVNEGPRFRVGNVGFRGNDSVPAEDLSKVLVNRPGRPYNPDAMGADEFALIMAYADRGYVFAGVMSAIDLASDSTADIAFDISEGRRVRVGRVGVGGNSFLTRKAIVRRVSIMPGEYFSRRDMLSGELSLDNTGLLHEARVLPGEVSPDSQMIDVEITVSERPRRRFEAGLGYGSGDAFRVMARWLNRNTGGDGERLEFSGLMAVQLWRDLRLVRGRAQSCYGEPWLFGLNLPTQASLYYDDHRPPYTDYRLQTVGFDLGLYQRLSGKAGVNWRASQQWLRLSPNWLDPGTPSDTIRYHGRRSVFSEWSVDRLDDPLMPRRGFSVQVDAEYTGGIFGGVNTFQRISTTCIGYLTVKNPRATLACRLRGGIIGDWGHTHQAPYYERFFLGGPTTLRGYSNGMAGALAPNGIPLGGKKMVLANIEARPAIYRRWSASLFLDVGILSDSPLRKMTMSEAYTSPGFGLRYVVPIGTGRLDLTAPGTQMEYIRKWKVIVAWGEVF